MRKVICLILCLCVIAMSICGCFGESSPPTETLPSGYQSDTIPSSQDGNNYQNPSVDKDFFELVCENCDMTMYALSSMQNFLVFSLISARDLCGEVITIASNLGGTIERTITEDKDPVLISAPVFLAYQDINWAALEGQQDAMQKEFAYFEMAFQEVRTTIPGLYSYKLILPLSELGVDLDAANPEYLAQSIETLIVTIAGKTKSYSIGSVRILAETVTENENYDGIDCETSIFSDYPASPSDDGALVLPKLVYYVKKDVVLQNFTVPGAEIMQCDVNIKTASGDKYNMQWNCNTPLELDAGSEICFENIYIQEPELRNKLYGNIIRYMILNYTLNEESCSAIIPISIRMRQDPFDIYALKVDGVDMLPYYIEYLNYK